MDTDPRTATGTALDTWAPSCYSQHQGVPCDQPAVWHETVSCHRCPAPSWSLACQTHHDHLRAGWVRCTRHHPALLRSHHSERM